MKRGIQLGGQYATGLRGRVIMYSNVMARMTKKGEI